MPTKIERELTAKKAELQALLEEAIEIYRTSSLSIINRNFGQSAGFDERRALASECALMYKRAEEMCRPTIVVGTKIVTLNGDCCDDDQGNEHQAPPGEIGTVRKIINDNFSVVFDPSNVWVFLDCKIFDPTQYTILG